MLCSRYLLLLLAWKLVLLDPSVKVVVCDFFVIGGKGTAFFKNTKEFDIKI